MIELFTENPWPLLWLCALAGLGLVIALYATGKGRLLALMVVPAVVAGVLLAVDWLIVTPRERVEGAIRAMTAAVRRRDADALLAYVAEDATLQRREPGSLPKAVKEVLGELELERLNLSDVEITFSKRLDPPRATAQFRATAGGRFRGSSFGLSVTYWRVVFERREGKWWVAEAQETQGGREGLWPAR